MERYVIEKYAVTFEGYGVYYAATGKAFSNDKEWGRGRRLAIGNTWEWCSDTFAADYYANSAEHSPSGPSEGNARVRRGGNLARSCRIRCRGYDDPKYYEDYIGFRLVLQLE